MPDLTLLDYIDEPKNGVEVAHGDTAAIITYLDGPAREECKPYPASIKALEEGIAALRDGDIALADGRLDLIEFGVLEGVASDE